MTGTVDGEFGWTEILQCERDSYLCNCMGQIHVIISKPKFEIFLKQDFGNDHGNGTGDIDQY